MQRDSPDVEGLISRHFEKQLHDIETNKRQVASDELPLARLKRIMKQDACEPHPRMISAEAVPFMALAAQLFIGKITAIAWKLSTQKAKRNTLQLKDLKDAVASTSRLDFLIDVVDTYQTQLSAENEADNEHIILDDLSMAAGYEHITLDDLSMAAGSSGAAQRHGTLHCAPPLAAPPLAARPAARAPARPLLSQGPQPTASMGPSQLAKHVPLVTHATLQTRNAATWPPAADARAPRLAAASPTSENESHVLLPRAQVVESATNLLMELEGLPQEVFDALDADPWSPIARMLGAKDGLVTDPFGHLLEEQDPEATDELEFMSME